MVEQNQPAVVLYVEDDDASAYALSVVLREQNANVEVFRSCNGEDAVLFLKHGGNFANAPSADIVLLDLNLPQKHGHEILAEIRQIPELQHVPLVIFSSSARPQDMQKALALGAIGYIHKPTDLDGFAAVAKQVLGFLFSG